MSLVFSHLEKTEPCTIVSLVPAGSMGHTLQYIFLEVSLTMLNGALQVRLHRINLYFAVFRSYIIPTGLQCREFTCGVALAYLPERMHLPRSRHIYFVSIDSSLYAIKRHSHNPFCSLIFQCYFCFSCQIIFLQTILFPSRCFPTIKMGFVQRL